MRKRRKNEQFMRHLIYDLKRDYGFPVIIVKTLSVSMDLESGVKQTVLDYRTVKRAVFLPARIFRSFVHDGSYFDPTDSVMLLDARDIDDFEIEVDDKVIYNNKEYTVVEVTDFVEGVLYNVRMRHVKGQSLNYPSTIEEIIILSDLVIGEKT